MNIKELTPDIIACMNADQMRDVLKSEYARIASEEIEQLQQEQQEQAENEKRLQVVKNFFARKKAEYQMQRNG